MHHHPTKWLFYLSHRHSQRHSHALFNRTQTWPAWHPTTLIESYSRSTRRQQSPVSAAVRGSTDVTHERRLRRDASGSEPGNTGAFCLARTKLVERREYGVADRQAPARLGTGRPIGLGGTARHVFICKDRITTHGMVIVLSTLFRCANS